MTFQVLEPPQTVDWPCIVEHRDPAVEGAACHCDVGAIIAREDNLADFAPGAAWVLYWDDDVRYAMRWMWEHKPMLRGALPRPAAPPAPRGRRYLFHRYRDKLSPGAA